MIIIALIAPMLQLTTIIKWTTTHNKTGHSSLLTKDQPRNSSSIAVIIVIPTLTLLLAL